MKEQAIPEEWTPGAVERAAVSDLCVRSIRAGRLTPEEGLLAAIFPPEEVKRYAREVHAPSLGLRPYECSEDVEERPVLTEEERRERARAREYDRYHNDPDYHARRIAQMRERRKSNADVIRAKDAERKRRARARKKGLDAR